MRYKEHFKTIQKVMRHVGVPVYCNKKDFRGPNPPFGYYSYWYRFVAVNPSMKPHEKIAVVTHEIGHAACYRKNCSCINRRWLCEVHAWKFCLQYLLEHECTKSLMFTMEQIMVLANDSVLEEYRQACRWLIKSSLWKRLCKLYHHDIVDWIKNRTYWARIMDSDRKLFKAMKGQYAD